MNKISMEEANSHKKQKHTMETVQFHEMELDDRILKVNSTDILYIDFIL